jgi:hypothetical protein
MNKILTILVVILLVVAGVWYFRNDDTSQTPGPQEQEQDQNGSNQSEDSSQDDTPSGDIITEEIPNGLKGQLQVSNDKRRGNLMLLLDDSDRIIYLNTSRDFSSLIGKEVVVSIEGSLDDFRLLDIQAQ